MTTRKTIALTIRTFIGKVMSLLLNMLSRFVTTFLSRSKCLYIYIYMRYIYTDIYIYVYTHIHHIYMNHFAV